MRPSWYKLFHLLTFFINELQHTNPLYTNFISYQLFEYELHPIHFFFATTGSRYEQYPIQTLSDAMHGIRTFSSYSLKEHVSGTFLATSIASCLTQLYTPFSAIHLAKPSGVILMCS